MTTLFNRTWLDIAAGTLVAFLLAACGGGDDDASPDPFPTPVIDSAVLPVLHLDANNATAAMGAVVFLSETAIPATLPGSQGAAANAGAGNPKRQAPSQTQKQAQFQTRLLTLVAHKVRESTQRLQSPVRTKSTSTACSLGGNATVVDNGIDASQAGAQVTLVFNHCVEPDSVLDGYLRTRISVPRNASNNGLTRFDVATDLTTTLGGRVAILVKGDLQASSDRTVSGLTASDLSGAVLMQQRIDGALTFSHQVTALQFSDLEFDGVDARDEARIAFTWSGSMDGLGDGSLSVATIEPLVTFGDDENPSSGVLRLAGANGSSVVVNVIDGQSLTLTADPASGAPVTVIDASWDDVRQSSHASP